MTAFDSHTSFWSLYLWPVVVGMALTLTSPWTRFSFDWASNVPLTKSRHMVMKNNINDAQAKLELERLKDEENKVRERALVDEAVRDREIKDLDLNLQEKENLIGKIEKVRGSSQSLDQKKYKFFDLISELELRSDDAIYLGLLSAGPITLNSRVGYISNKLVGVFNPNDLINEFPSFDLNRLIDLMINFGDRELVIIQKVAEGVERYDFTISGLELANFMNEVEGHNKDELKAILTLNEEKY